MIAARNPGRFVWFPLAACLLAAGTIGCAYRNAMAAAEEHATAQRWREAVEEYRNALDASPGDAGALAGLAAVAPYAIADALRDGRAALAAGDYETTLLQRDYVLGLDPASADARQLEADVLARMDAVLQQLVAAERMEEAYGFANRENALFPGAPALPAAYATIRGWFYARSDESFAARDFASALAALDTILAYEPGLAGEVQAKGQAIRVSWADDVVAQAKTRSTDGRRGAAALLFARAYEIAGRPGDLTQARELAAALRQEGRLRINLTLGGDAGRLETVRAALEGGVAAISGATPVADASQADLVVLVETGTTTCDQSSRSWEGAQAYVAGYNQYENPEYRQAAIRVDELQRAIVDAGARLASAQASASRAWTDANGFEQGTMQPLWSEMSQLNEQIQSVSVQLDGRRRLVAEMEAEIDDARARGASEDALLASTMTLGTLRQDVIDMENTIYLAQMRLSELQAQESGFSSQYQSLRGAAESWSGKVQNIDLEVQNLRAELDGTEARRTSLSPTLVEEVPGTFTFAITEWTRVCGGDFRLTAEPRWGDRRSESLTFSNSWQVVDQANDAYPDYGVAADPLAFSMTDWDLIREADLASSQQMIDAIRGRAGQFFAYRWQTGSDTLSSDPGAAIDQLLMVYLAAPDRVDASGVALLQQHAATYYGLADFLALGL
jgi:hypothetical protein